MKNDKEIIDEIVNRLKSRPEVEYRQGAWEGFKDQHSIGATKMRQIPRWAAAAAAALLLFGIGTLYYFNESVVTPEGTAIRMASDAQSQANKELPSQEEKIEKTAKAVATTTSTSRTLFGLQDKRASERLEQLPPLMADVKTIDSRPITITADDISLMHDEIRKYSNIGASDVQSYATTVEHLTLATTAIPKSDVSVREVENISQNRNVRFGDKFDLGLYVSPQSTGDKMNVGGGLTLAYNLTSKISLRTGASYNSYEVGRLKNPNAADSYESVFVRNDMDKNMLNSPSAETSKMMVPNVNAVTSIVQSVDVPLELKYNVGKSLYAVAGVSYSAIIGQERNAHYIENVNAETFSTGFPENEKQMQTAVKAVTKTVKSADKSVSTNGFNGFVNFSVGKKVKVNNRFGVSVEPYFKIPVGEYRRADMDYTNGGIRIMTNF